MINILSHDNFIGLYDNVLSVDECTTIIDSFNLIETNQKQKIIIGSDAYRGELNRNDFWIFANEHLPKIHELIGLKLHSCLLSYCEHYFVLKDIHAASLDVKLQRTPPRGGYHVWHCEQDSLKHASRVLVWTIYLNDVPYNEGETEFLWQGVRINPKAGRCAIWPAAFTHKHRGNPVYTHDKYIATGWYTFT